MTPEQLAARVLANCPRYDSDGDPSGQFDHKIFVKETDALAAIARHLAPGDDLVERATAALEGVTEGKPCQFHPSYCKEAEGAPFSEWDSSHDLSVILPDGKRYKIGQFRHSADAAFDQFARQWVPEAAARIAALTSTVAELEATVAEVTSDRAYIIGANAGWEAAVEHGQATPAAQAVLACANAAEAEVSRLRDRLARMEGALTNLPAVYAHQINTGVREVYDPLQRFFTLESVFSALTDGGSNG